MQGMTQTQDPCPICDMQLVYPITSLNGDQFDLHCRNCGHHRLAGSARAELGSSNFKDNAVDRARIMYALSSLRSFSRKRRRRSCQGQQRCSTTCSFTMATTVQPGEPRTLEPMQLRAVIGAQSWTAAHWTIEELVREGLLRREHAPEGYESTWLTAKGWERYRQLLRDGVRSQHAFMAMQFNDPELDDVFVNHLKPTVALTGFELRRNDDPSQQQAGLIDNHMRVQIRASRFLVCDLSHGNRGAYWEAGFAEGLGRPVIFICRKDVFDNASHEHHPHFDTKHHATIVWDPMDLAPAMRQLKDMIRATLPSETTSEDKA